MNITPHFFVACLLAVIGAITITAQAAEYPQWLPPADQVKTTLENLPQLRASRSGVLVEQANAGRLRAGNQEWTARAGMQQRRERIGQDYFENELALERPIRFSVKADKDIALGENGIEVADAALADNWHEAARMLMSLWFGWLREERQALRLQEYARNLERELQIVQKRVKAGDAPRMEMMLAETELAKAQSAHAQARRRALLLATEIEKKFPGVIATAPAALPAPLPLEDSAATWQQKILTDNHELELAELTARHEKLLADRISLERRPDPTVGVRMARERGGSEHIFGLTFSMPLPGEYRRKQTDAALARAQMAQEHAQETRVKVESSAMQVALQAASAPSLWKQLSDVAAQTEANAALVSRAYALGEAPLSDTLLARRHAIEAQGIAEQTQIDALESWSRLLLDTHAIWSLHEGHEHR